MQFSALITGFSVDDLDTDVAAQIVEAVNEGPGGAQALQAMLQQAQGCHTLADLEQRVFTNQAHQELADDILEAWFTGVVSYPKGPVVATFMGSLAWQCLGYTGAPSACHEPWWTHPVAPS